MKTTRTNEHRHVILKKIACLSLVGAFCLHQPSASAADPKPSVADSTSIDSVRSVPEIEWDTKLSKFQFDSEKFLGQRLTLKCPPIPRKVDLDGVHGIDDYPSDSAICVAALHAGAITEQGGIVTVQLNPGESEYLGSLRNGVATRSLPGTPRSLSFVTKATKEKNDRIQLEHLPRLSWDTKFTATGFAYRHLVGQRFAFRVPEAPLDRKMRLVFGTDNYDFSSVVSVAALHAGVITKAGGVVVVQLDRGVPRLVGSIRNGVESKSKNGRDRSLSFVKPSGMGLATGK